MGQSNELTVSQIGSNNIGYAGILGEFNTLEVTQVGDANQANAINFNGVGNVVSIEQIGNENDGAITLASTGAANGNEILASQVGDLNLLDLVVNGDGNTINILQEGTGNWITAEEGATFEINASFTSFSVEQLGNENLIVGEIIGVGGSVLISQIGDYNIATVYQN